MNKYVGLDSLYFSCLDSYKGYLKKLGLKLRLRLSKRRAKLQEITEVLTGRCQKEDLKFKELVAIAEDMKAAQVNNVSPFIIRENILAVKAEGARNNYIGLFNLSNSYAKVYIDLSFGAALEEIDGAVTEVFSDMSYMITEGKLYIRKLEGMDCRLFVREKSK